MRRRLPLLLLLVLTVCWRGAPDICTSPGLSLAELLFVQHPPVMGWDTSQQTIDLRLPCGGLTEFRRGLMRLACEPVVACGFTELCADTPTCEAWHRRVCLEYIRDWFQTLCARASGAALGPSLFRLPVDFKLEDEPQAMILLVDGEPRPMEVSASPTWNPVRASFEWASENALPYASYALLAEKALRSWARCSVPHLWSDPAAAIPPVVMCRDSAAPPVLMASVDGHKAPCLAVVDADLETARHLPARRPGQLHWIMLDWTLSMLSVHSVQLMFRSSSRKRIANWLEANRHKHRPLHGNSDAETRDAADGGTEAEVGLHLLLDSRFLEADPGAQRLRMQHHSLSGWDGTEPLLLGVRNNVACSGVNITLPFGDVAIDIAEVRVRGYNRFLTQSLATLCVAGQREQMVVDTQNFEAARCVHRAAVGTVAHPGEMTGDGGGSLGKHAVATVSNHPCQPPPPPRRIAGRWMSWRRRTRRGT